MCPIRITPFLKGVANRLSATDALPGNPRQILLYGLCRRLSILLLAFNRFHCFSGRFGPDFSQVAPEQHHPFSALRKKWSNTAPPPLPVCCFHIHSKTACRGFKSFCPCQKSQVSLLRYLTFSLVCGRIWQRGAPAGSPAVRVVGRWSPVATVQRRPRRQPRQVRPLIFS